MGGQGVLRADELCGAGVGYLEGQWYGSITDDKE